MRVFIVGKRTGRVLEVVSYDSQTHVAVLRSEKGEEITDPNFWPEMVKRIYDIEQRED